MIIVYQGGNISMNSFKKVRTKKKKKKITIVLRAISGALFFREICFGGG